MNSQKLKEDALHYHSKGRPGKIEVRPTKETLNQRDLSLAYSPGVAEPCLEIEKFPALGTQDWYEELIATDNVILTPHVGGWTLDSYRKISEVLAEKLAAL